MHTDRPTSRPTQAERVQATRDRLLDSAAELVIERGYHATTATAIADRAGCSREMVRVRFGSTLALMRELLVEEYQHAFRSRLPADATALEQLHDGVEQLATMSSTAPTRLRAAYLLAFESAPSAHELHDDVLPWLTLIETRFAELLNQAQAEGSIVEVDSDEYARLLIAAATGAAFLFATSPTAENDPASPLRTVLDSLLPSSRQQT